MIRRDIPKDVPVNSHTVGTAAWAKWIEKARKSTDYVFIIITEPYLQASLITYPFLNDYKPYFDRQEAYWFRLEDVLATEVPKEKAISSIVVEDLSRALARLEAVRLDIQNVMQAFKE